MMQKRTIRRQKSARYLTMTLLRIGGIFNDEFDKNLGQFHGKKIVKIGLPLAKLLARVYMAPFLTQNGPVFCVTLYLFKFCSF